MKLLFPMLALLSLVGCRTTSIIDEYDPKTGKLIRRVETSESVITQVTNSTKTKMVYAYQKGWLAKLSVSPGTTEDPTPHLKAYAGSLDQGLLTVPKDMDTTNLAEIIRSCASSNLSVTQKGITGSTGGEK